MKNSTKILVGITLSIMLMGGAYATWTDGLIVKADVGTYSFEGEVIMVEGDFEIATDEINDSLEATATFKISDSSPKVKVRNTGTIPIYIEEVRVNYVANYKMENVNNYTAIQRISFDEIGNDGSTDKRLGIALSDLFDGTTPEEDVVLVGIDYFKIEPEPRESGLADESTRTIQLGRELSLVDLTSKWDAEVTTFTEEIQKLDEKIRNPEEGKDISGYETQRTYKQDELERIESIIEDINEAFRQDEIELEFHFKMAN